MNATTRQVFSPEIGQLLNASVWVLKTAWLTNTRLTLGLGVVVVLRGILPAGLALAARGLINAAVEASRSGAGDLTLLLPWLFLGFLLAVIEALSPLVNRFSLQCLSDDINLSLTSRCSTMPPRWMSPPWRTHTCGTRSTGRDRARPEPSQSL